MIRKAVVLTTKCTKITKNSREYPGFNSHPSDEALLQFKRLFLFVLSVFFVVQLRPLG